MDQDSRALQEHLIDELIGCGAVRSPAIEAAFRKVPRHLFLPGVPLDRVYSNEAIVTRSADGKPVSSSSQPEVMAWMLEQLDIRPGARVLEIGAGTGYNAALLAEIVGSSGPVSTIDLEDAIVNEARERLASAGYDRVRAYVGDGWEGVLQDAPYDGIEVTVGMWDISPLWTAQLREGGTLVVPLALGRHFTGSVAFRRRGEELIGRDAVPAGFMPLRGPHASPPELAELVRGTTVGGWWTSIPAEGPGTELVAELLATTPNVEWERPGVEAFWLGDQPDVIQLGRAEPRMFAVGLLSLEERGMALVASSTPMGGAPTHRLLSYGSRGPLARLRQVLPRSSLRQLEIDAVPSHDEPTDQDGSSVRRSHYTFRFRRG